MIAGLAGTKGEVNHAVHSQLLHPVQAPRAQVLAQLQREIGGRVRLLFHVLHMLDHGSQRAKVTRDNHLSGLIGENIILRSPQSEVACTYFRWCATVVVHCCQSFPLGILGALSASIFVHRGGNT